MGTQGRRPRKDYAPPAIALSRSLGAARGGALAVALVAIGLVAAVPTAGAASGLASQGCIDDNDSGPDNCAASTNGMAGASDVAVSPNGASVYVASFEDDAITRFSRDTTTGALSAVDCIQDNDTGSDTCATSTDGLDGVGSVVVSSDGKSVYAGSFTDDAVVRFDRNTTTGALTPAGCVDDNDTGADNCAQTTDGLDGAFSTALSTDDKSLYVSSAGDDAVVRLDRNTTSGAITPVDCVDDNDTGPESCAASGDGLDRAIGVAVSADDKSVYVAGADDDAIARLDRNLTTGALTYSDCVDDNDSGADLCGQSTNGLDVPWALTVSPDNESVYVASNNDNAIVHLDRNPTNGALTPVDCIDDSDEGKVRIPAARVRRDSSTRTTSPRARTASRCM